MTLTADIRQALSATGPFATAYLDGSRDTEQGEREVGLRWRSAREQLAQAGADDATLAALDGAIDTDREVPGRHGHLLVAAGGQVLLDAVSDEPPLTELADWSAAPHLVPFLARRGKPIPAIVVVADRTGANIYLSTGDSLPRLTDPEQVTGTESDPIHKTGRNVWSESHFQHRVENSWAENAADVAHSVRKSVADTAVRLVLVAGDVRARNLIMHALADELPPGVDLSETTAGGRADGASLAAVEGAARDAVLRVRWRDRREILAKLQQGVARSDFGVTGIDPVLQALRSGQAETVVLSDEPESSATAWIGEDPRQLTRDEATLADLGVREPQQVRLDAALVRSVAASGADLLITPGGHRYLEDGIGAVLRYARNPGTVS